MFSLGFNDEFDFGFRREFFSGLIAWFYRGLIFLLNNGSLSKIGISVNIKLFILFGIFFVIVTSCVIGLELQLIVSKWNKKEIINKENVLVFEYNFIIMKIKDMQ